MPQSNLIASIAAFPDHLFRKTPPVDDDVDSAVPAWNRPNCACPGASATSEFRPGFAGDRLRPAAVGRGLEVRRSRKPPSGVTNRSKLVIGGWVLWWGARRLVGPVPGRAAAPDRNPCTGMERFRSGPHGLTSPLQADIRGRCPGWSWIPRWIPGSDSPPDPVGIAKHLCQ